MDSPRWVHVHTVDEMEAFYRAALPKMRAAARELGWALGAHGSMRRDMDLIAAPWREVHSTKDELAEALQKAACGMKMARYEWSTDKPCGRTGTVFAICWCEWPGCHDILSLGCVDLSVMPDTAPPRVPTKAMMDAGYAAAAFPRDYEVCAAMWTSMWDEAFK